MAQPTYQQNEFYKFLEELSGNDEATLDRLLDIHAETGVSVKDMDDNQLAEAKKNFAVNVLLPRLDKNLVDTKSEDYQYYKDIAKRANKYADNHFDRDQETLVKYYGAKNLGQLASDEEWVGRQAALQDTSPDVIKKEISDAFSKYQKKIAEEAQNEAKSETVKARKQIWDDYENGKFDSENGGVLGTVARFVADNPFARRVNAQLKKNVLNGTDDSSLDDALIDAAQGVGETVIGSGVGGYLGKQVLKKGGSALAGTVADIAGGVGTDILSNIAGQVTDIARGDQDKFDLGQTKNTGEASATISGGASLLIAGLGKIPGLQQVARQVAKTLKKSGTNAAEAEKDSFMTVVKNAKESAERAKANKKDISLQDRARVDEESAGKYSQDPRVTRKNEEIDAKIEAENAKPKPSKRKINNLEKQRVQYPDRMPTKEEYEAMMPEERSKIRELYPEWFKEITAKPATKTQKGVGATLAGFAKTSERSAVRAVSNPKDKKNEESVRAEEFNVDPLTIRMWDAGFKPNSENERNLYNQYKKKYPNGGK